MFWVIACDGGDEFAPPLAPVVSRGVHVWQNEAWHPVAALDGPLGIVLPHDGKYRITAEVGAGDVPAAVLEAFRRLAEYLADDPGASGASSTAVSIGPISETVTRAPSWRPKAMQLSGAGDLLRPYRRA